DTLSGFGFQAGETVVVSSRPAGLFSTASLTADTSGNFTRVLSINSVMGGDYQVNSIGQTSGYAGTTLYHIGQISLSPDWVVNSVASDVTFSGAGFEPNEIVDISNDNTTDLFASFTTTADSAGSFSVTLTV